MDAVKYLKEKRRMCDTNRKRNPHSFMCNTCDLGKNNNKVDLTCVELECIEPQKSVDIVENWSKEHPKKTRADVFIELFPKAKEKVYDICPMKIEGMDCMIIMNHIGVCDGCLEAYWNSTAPEGFGKIK
jgi:hypothetical protein